MKTLQELLGLIDNGLEIKIERLNNSYKISYDNYDIWTGYSTLENVIDEIYSEIEAIQNVEKKCFTCNKEFNGKYGEYYCIECIIKQKEKELKQLKKENI